MAPPHTMTIATATTLTSSKFSVLMVRLLPEARSFATLHRDRERERGPPPQAESGVRRVLLLAPRALHAGPPSDPGRGRSARRGSETSAGDQGGQGQVEQDRSNIYQCPCAPTTRASPPLGRPSLPFR